MGAGSEGEREQRPLCTTQLRPEKIFTGAIPITEPSNPRLSWTVIWHVQILQRSRRLPDGECMQIQACQEAGRPCGPVLLLAQSPREVEALLPHPMRVEKAMDALHPCLPTVLEALPPDGTPWQHQAFCLRRDQSGLEALPPDAKPSPGRTTEDAIWATSFRSHWTCSLNSKRGALVHVGDTFPHTGNNTGPGT